MRLDVVEYAMGDAGLRLPTQLPDQRAQCRCGAPIDIPSMAAHAHFAHTTHLRSSGLSRSGTFAGVAGNSSTAETAPWLPFLPALSAGSKFFADGFQNRVDSFAQRTYSLTADGLNLPASLVRLHPVPHLLKDVIAHRALEGPHFGIGRGTRLKAGQHHARAFALRTIGPLNWKKPFGHVMHPQANGGSATLSQSPMNAGETVR